MTTFPAYLQRLGISAEADERTIRRAYARELKLIDQEADPAGFQTLREAYDEALHWSRYRAEEFHADTEVHTIEPAAEALPATLQQPIAVSEREPTTPPPLQAQELFTNDHETAAEAVFAEFMERCGRIVAGTPVMDSGPFERELRLSLADTRLISIIARDCFERHVADLLAAGWRPGNEALLVAATIVFDWENDRRRVASLGQAGAMLDRALEQRAMFDLQPGDERVRQRLLIQRLRVETEPSTRELVLHSPTLEKLIARFPEWLALIASVPRIVDWRTQASQVPAWRRKLTFTGWRKPAKVSYEHQQSGFNWKWLVFMLVIGLARFASNTSQDHGSGNHSGGKPAIQLSARFSELLEQGNQQLDSGNRIGAIESYSKAIDAEPNSADAYARRAQAYFFEKEYPLAKRDVEKAFSLDRSNLIMLAVRGMIAMNEKQYPDALADFTRAIQLAPDVAYFYHQRAWAYYRDGQIKAALADAAESIRKKPQGNAGAYSLAALLHKSAGAADQAAAQAEALITADGTVPENYIVAAQIYLLLEKKPQALAILERGSKAAPSVKAHLFHANLLPVADLAGRRAAVNAALAIDPKDFRTLKMRADIEREAGNLSAAITAYNTMLNAEQESSNRIALLLERGYTYLKQGNIAAANSDIASARATSTTALDLNNMCWFLATRNLQLQTALDACSAALVKEPTLAAALDSKGFVLLRLKRYGEALATYDAVLAQRQQFPSSLHGRGIAKRHLGREQEANADIQAAADLDSSVASQFAGYGVR